MKKLFLSAACFILLGAGLYSQPKLTKDNIPLIVKAMTAEEKALFVVGVQFEKEPYAGKYLRGTGGVTYPIPRLGIPSIVMMDGPVGIRLYDYPTTCFPGGLLTAASWDRSVAFRIGQAIGEESIDMGNDVILAPGMNILRNPLNGRNFEYFSEDPVLTGLLAAAYVNGVQGAGVGTSAKHFAANNQETNRLDGDSRLDTRTLREIYTKAFELCVRDSDPWTVMASYNYLNGEYTQESYDLLQKILRDDFGYRGLVVTDWTGKRNTPKQLHAGSDLLMGGRPEQTEHILECLENGTLKMADLDRACTKLLELIVKTPAFKGNKPSLKPDLDSHTKLARELAADGMVLLKNDGTLPLQAARAALFGVHSYHIIHGGNGSARVSPPHLASLDEGLAAAGFSLNEDLRKLYKEYDSFISRNLDFNQKVKVLVGVPQKPELEISRKLIEETVKDNDLAVITIGRISGEARDRILDRDFLLQDAEIRLLRDVCDVYHSAGKKVVVVLNICGPVETASWKGLPDAILCAWLPGEEGGNAIADVLTGKANPSGRLPMTFPVNYFDAAGAENFPYNFVSDRPNESAAHPERRGMPMKDIAWTDYTEGIYVGYRYFCSKEKSVSYPFGYGLSYTSFDYSKASVKVKGNRIVATVTVTNNGSAAGKEATGFYVKAPLGTFNDKPSLELREFGKTGLLQPGESQTLTFTVPVRQLASFNSAGSRWETAKGTYEAFFGADATKPEARATFKLSSAKAYPVSRACEKRAGKEE
jgi:beta-glucosidase